VQSYDRNLGGSIGSGSSGSESDQRINEETLMQNLNEFLFFEIFTQTMTNL
jgi:hypothetical protein